MKKSTLTAMLIGVAMTCLAAIGGLRGKWSGSVKLPDGITYPVHYELKVSGTQLTGAATAEGLPKASATARSMVIISRSAWPTKTDR